MDIILIKVYPAYKYLKMKINSVFQMEKNKTALLYLKYILKINNIVSVKMDIGGIKQNVKFAHIKHFYQILQYLNYVTVVILVNN